MESFIDQVKDNGENKTLTNKEKIAIIETVRLLTLLNEIQDEN